MWCMTELEDGSPPGRPGRLTLNLGEAVNPTASFPIVWLLVAASRTHHSVFASDALSSTVLTNDFRAVAVRSCVVGCEWPQARRAMAGLADSTHYFLCGDAPGTLAHEAPVAKRIAESLSRGSRKRSCSSPGGRVASAQWAVTEIARRVSSVAVASHAGQGCGTSRRKQTASCHQRGAPPPKREAQSSVSGENVATSKSELAYLASVAAEQNDERRRACSCQCQRVLQLITSTNSQTEFTSSFGFSFFVALESAGTMQDSSDSQM